MLIMLMKLSAQGNELWAQSLKYDNFRQVIFKLVLVIDGWSTSCEIALSLLSLDLTEDRST